MTVQRRVAVVATATVLALGLASCAQSQREDSTGGTASGTSGGTSGGTFTFGAAGAPKVFDPFYATDGETFRISRQMFEGLITFKAGTADPAPSLATEWTSTPDGLTWTFTLAQGVKFHDGTDFNADAVCKNFTRMYSHTGVAATAAVSQYWSDNFGGFQGKGESLFKSCAAKDASTAVLTLSRVTSKFPAILGLPSFSMQSPTAMDKFKANEVTQQGEGFVFSEYATKNPTGTGPFTFEAYDQANKTVTLARNESYWGSEKPSISKLVFKIIPDEAARRQELQAGSIQGYDLPNPVDWKALTDAGNKVMVRPAFNILYLGLNATPNPKLKDLRVRQALQFAINRQQIVTTQLPEGATAATQFIPDTVAGYNTTLQVAAYDKAKAQALLKEAGAEGMTLELWYPSEVSRPYMPAPQKIFEAIRTDLEAVGIKVTPVTKPWNGGYLEQVDASKASAFLLGWTGDYNTADNFIGTFFSDPTNRFATKNYPFAAELTKALATADATADEATRTKLYEDLNSKLVLEYLPAIPISHSPPALVVAGNISGITPSPLTDEKFAPVTIG